MIRPFFLLLFAALLLQSCAVVRRSAKYDFGEGVYYSSLLRPAKARVFIAEDKEKDTLRIMPMIKEDVFDTSRKVLLPLLSQKYMYRRNYFKPSLDVDALTIPFKYRPVAEGFPQQLNANYNIALYIGYRTDAYHTSYHTNHLGEFTRHITHVGFSIGAFGGIGATAINSWVTNNKVAIEYDGFIYTKGLAAIFAVNNLSAGMGIGFDNLTDKNKDYWIYQGRHWVGLMVGLNLN